MDDSTRQPIGRRQGRRRRVDVRDDVVDLLQVIRVLECHSRSLRELHVVTQKCRKQLVDLELLWRILLQQRTDDAVAFFQVGGDREGIIDQVLHLHLDGVIGDQSTDDTVTGLQSIEQLVEVIEALLDGHSILRQHRTHLAEQVAAGGSDQMLSIDGGARTWDVLQIGSTESTGCHHLETVAIARRQWFPETYPGHCQPPGLIE